MKYLVVFLMCCGSIFKINAQNILPNANTIIVKGVGFNEVCNALLDSGYTIDKKDNDLLTTRTEPKKYPKYWNGVTYVFNIRVKDSIAYLSGTFTTHNGGGLLSFTDEPIINDTNKKGVTYKKSMDGYPFLLLNEFALGFKKEVSYEVK